MSEETVYVPPIIGGSPTASLGVRKDSQEGPGEGSGWGLLPIHYGRLPSVAGAPKRSSNPRMISSRSLS